MGHEVHLIVGPPWPDTDAAVTRATQGCATGACTGCWRRTDLLLRPSAARGAAPAQRVRAGFEPGGAVQRDVGVQLAGVRRLAGAAGALRVRHRARRAVAGVRELADARERDADGGEHPPSAVDRPAEPGAAGAGDAEKIRKVMFYPFWMQEVVARRMDRIITGSHNSRGRACRGRSGCGTTQITTIHDGVDTEVFRPLAVRESGRGPCCSWGTATTGTRARGTCWRRRGCWRTAGSTST